MKKQTRKNQKMKGRNIWNERRKARYAGPITFSNAKEKDVERCQMILLDFGNLLDETKVLQFIRPS